MRLNIREKAVYSKGLGPREQELMKEQEKGQRKRKYLGVDINFLADGDSLGVHTLAPLFS